MVENVWKLIKVTNVNAPTDLLDTTAKVNRLWVQLQYEPTGIVMSSKWIYSGFLESFLSTEYSVRYDICINDNLM